MVQIVVQKNEEKQDDAVKNQVPEGQKVTTTPNNADTRPSETSKDIVVGRKFKMSDGSWCHFIDDPTHLDEKVISDPSIKGVISAPSSHVAFDCEGVPESLELLQIASMYGTYVLDCKVLGAKLVCQKLENLFKSENQIKFIHDVHKDAVALDGLLPLESVLDTQLVAEYLWGETHLGFNGLLTKLELPTHPSKDFVHAKMKSGVDLWSERPIPKSSLEYAAMDASYLRKAAVAVKKLLSDKEIQTMIEASALRARNAVANNGMRAICFDVTNDYSIASAELVQTFRPLEGYFGEPLIVESNVNEVIEVLPPRLQTKFVGKPTLQRSNLFERMGIQRSNSVVDQSTEEEILPFDNLSDIVLDVGRRPQCWIDDQRVFLCDDESEVVTDDEIKYIEARLGEFGSDNRAGLNGKLHRFSAIRNRDKVIAGITIRVGKHVRGNAAMLMDFLLGSDKSILILGEPGSGKTTIVREATRKLAENKNVVVVDTSNEIAGDGMIPHSCIGLARRMMVPSLDEQSSVMIECVQNHTPHVMVIDEIGRPREVQAARTVKQRGVRMIASAHGDLRRLLKNKDLCGLVGGIEHVTMGDDMAKEEAKRKAQMAAKVEGERRSFSVSKTKVQRGGDPTFEVIVEVRRGSRHEWKIVADSAKAVDKILDGFPYQAQLRARNPETGEMRTEFVQE